MLMRIIAETHVTKYSKKCLYYFEFYMCRSIKYRMIKVNTTTCTTNPTVVGQPTLFAMDPKNPESNELTNLYVHGLKMRIATRTV
jgi:hypothetical protein